MVKNIAGVPLAFTLTGTYTAGDAAIAWSMGSTPICDAVRGLPSGKGGCP